MDKVVDTFFFSRQITSNDTLFKVLTTAEKGNIVVVFIEIIMKRNDINCYMCTQLFSDVLEHEDVSIISVGVHEIPIEVGDI